MSQFPPPYSQPAYPQPPIDFMQYVPASQPELLAPAKRASILQAIVGGLLLFCGVCIGTMPWVVNMNFEEIVAASGMKIPDLPPDMTLEQVMRIAYTLVGGCGSIFGILLLVLSFYVRRGGSGPVIASIVLESMVILVLAMNGVSALFQMTSNPMAGAAALVFLSVPLALFGLNVAWLIAAARNASRLRDLRAQYQAQFYQYQQTQQAYAQPGGYGVPYPPQAGYGYGYPTAPAMSAPTPPPSQPGGTTPRPDDRPPASP